MNHEGYRDETAEHAIAHARHVTRVESYEDPVLNDVSEAVDVVKKIFHAYGFEVVGRIRLKSKKNGKTYK
ncbi:MAG: hypothetical protein Q4B26_04800 [Eubacteriales bacterium]|nr:hypothetical protein [Eubacteriales bacterium]